MGLGKFLQKFDLYKKVEEDFLKSTVGGASLSIIGLIIMFVLFALELNDYMTPQVEVDMALDEDLSHSDMLGITFNITINDLPCAYLSLDISDATGERKHNVTQNIHKFRIDHLGHNLGQMEDQHHVETDEAKEVQEKEEDAYADAIEFHGQGHSENVEGMAAMETIVKRHPRRHEIVFADFYAPWCIWCQRLSPVWDKMSVQLGNRGPIWAVKVDCTSDANDELCRSMHVRAFPTMLMFRHGDMHPFEAYHGERTVEALIDRLKGVAKGDQLPADKKRIQLHKQRGGGKNVASGAEGCNVNGLLKVKKVPGTLTIRLSSPRYSVDASLINATHQIHRLWFTDLASSGDAKFPTIKNTGNRMRMLSSWMQSPLNNQDFVSEYKNQTYVHYLKLVAKSFLTGSGDPDGVHGYHYSSYSNEHVEDDDIPAVVFQYDLSPISIVETEKYQPFYHFITNFMAIVGGVFAMIGLVESFTHQISKALYKKRL